MGGDRRTCLLAGMICTLLSSGCATSRYTQSRIAPGAPSAGSGASRVEVQAEGLKLAIETLDRSVEGAGARPLSLRFVFEPEELGYSFDPGQVVLRAVDGQAWRATESGYRPLYSKASIDVHFDTTVDSEAPIELVVKGLARGPKRMPPLRFRLVRTRGRSIDGPAPWLASVGKVVGYAILIPLELVAYAGGVM